MHGILGVGAHRAIPHQQFLDVLGDRTMDRVRRRRRTVHVAGRRAQRPRQLRAMAGRGGAGIEQPITQPVQQLPIGGPIPAPVLDELDLPLPPLLLGGSGVEPSGVPADQAVT